jgi:hypothetical protein
MEQRIYGVETEYALSVETADHRLLASDPGKLFNALEGALLERFATLEADSFGRVPGSGQRDGIEIREGRFLENGGRFYYDAGHLEWATPECTSARQAVLYELAGERLLAELAATLELPAGARLLLLKNNVDYARGTTFGCHENYLVARARGRADQALFERLVQQLVPFLVTRQVFTGAGRIGGAAPRDGAGVGFQISQRADFITEVTSQETRSRRAIVNQRDESLGDRQRYRRLHLILGDSNRSPFATFLKLGTTGLVIELIEAGALSAVPVLADPVAALKAVSRDLTCRRPIPLAGSGAMSSLEVQYRYLESAERHLAAHPRADESALVVAEWRRVLDDLAQDPVRVADRVDWMIKRHHLLDPRLRQAETGWAQVAAWSRLLTEIEHDRDRRAGAAAPTALPSAEHCARFQFFVDRHELSWHDYPAQRRLHFELRERDLRYHDIGPERGLFAALAASGLVAPFLAVDSPAVAAARSEPPPDTRARLRAAVIRWAHRSAHTDTLLDWGRVAFPGSGGTVRLDDPFCAALPALEHRLGGPEDGPDSPRTPAGSTAYPEIPIRILGVVEAESDAPDPQRTAGWLKKIFGG